MDDHVRRLVLGCRCVCCERRRTTAPPVTAAPPAPQGLWLAEAVGNWPDFPDPAFVAPRGGAWSPQLPRSVGDTAFVPQTTWTPEPDPQPRRRGKREGPGPGGYPLHTVIDDLGGEHGSMESWQTVDHHARVVRNRKLAYAYNPDPDPVPMLLEALGDGVVLNPATPWLPWDPFQMRSPILEGVVTRVVGTYQYRQQVIAADTLIRYETGTQAEQATVLSSSDPYLQVTMVEVAPHQQDTGGRLHPDVIYLVKDTRNLSEDRANHEDLWLVYRIMHPSVNGEADDLVPLQAASTPATGATGVLYDRPGDLYSDGAMLALGRYNAALDAETPAVVQVSGPFIVLTTKPGVQVGDYVLTQTPSGAAIQTAAFEAGLTEPPLTDVVQPQLIYRDLTVTTGGSQPHALIGARTVDLTGNTGWEALEGPGKTSALLLWLDADAQLHVETASAGHTVTAAELMALCQLEEESSAAELKGTPAFHTPARRAYLKLKSGDWAVLAAWHPWRDGSAKLWGDQKLKRPATWKKWLEYRAASKPLPDPPVLPVVLADLMP